MPKNLGVDTFPDPVGHFRSPGGHFGFCRQCGVAGGERVPPSPLGWYFLDIIVRKFVSWMFWLFFTTFAETLIYSFALINNFSSNSFLSKFVIITSFIHDVSLSPRLLIEILLEKNPFY